MSTSDIYRKYFYWILFVKRIVEERREIKNENRDYWWLVLGITGQIQHFLMHDRVFQTMDGAFGLFDHLNSLEMNALWNDPHISIEQAISNVLNSIK